MSTLQELVDDLVKRISKEIIANLIPILQKKEMNTTWDNPYPKPTNEEEKLLNAIFHDVELEVGGQIDYSKVEQFIWETWNQWPTRVESRPLIVRRVIEANAF